MGGSRSSPQSNGSWRMPTISTYGLGTKVNRDDCHGSTGPSQPSPQETGAVLPGSPGTADPGQRQEVLPASAAAGADAAARHERQESAADHQRYPVLVLSNEWLEELFCPKCGSSRWCHVIKHDKISHTVRWAPRDLWEQVAHVDPTAANPTVSEYTRRNARRNAIKRVDGKRFYD